MGKHIIIAYASGGKNAPFLLEVVKLEHIEQ